MTRWKLHKRCWARGTGLAVVTEEQVEQFNIPPASFGGARGRHWAAGDYFLVDRRRLQRCVRREAESIARDIRQLGSMLDATPAQRPGNAHG